jgi:hypothetical protein
MMLSLSVSLIWLLALLAASAHVQRGSRGATRLLTLALGFGATLLLARFLSPQPNWVGVIVGVTAMWQLIGGPLPRIGNLLGAVCAGLAASLQVAGGVPLWLAGPLAAAALFGAALLLRPGSARSGVTDVVLIVVALAAPVVGLAGDLVYGWQSASVLGGMTLPSVKVSTPGWAIGIVVLALLAGALRGIWKR